MRMQKSSTPLKRLRGGLAALALVFFLAAAGGCAAQFTEAMAKGGGPQQCRTLCQGWGLKMSGMIGLVYGSKATSACVCETIARPASRRKLGPAAASAAVLHTHLKVQEQLQRQRQRQQQARRR
jgi:hypothetical protein